MGFPGHHGRSLPLGSAGEVIVAIDVDGSGKVTRCEPSDPKTAPAHLVEAIKRTFFRLKQSKVGLDKQFVEAGSLELRLKATLTDVPVPPDQDGPFGFDRSYAGGKGRAAFTLETGRHVELHVELVRVERR